jgi:hypothetical protein
MEPTILQVFGTAASQTDTALSIQKADLATVGLTASTTNTAESLFVAILLKAKEYLSVSNQQANPDIQITIEDGGQTLIERNEAFYRQRFFYVYAETLETQSGIDPDDY